MIFSSDELRKLSKTDTIEDIEHKKHKIKIIPKIKPKDKSCYLFKDNKFQKIQFFSQETNKLYKLIPTKEKPILKISSTPMHKKDFVDLIKNSKLTGKILDSGTGLGYTAIEASKTADELITVEIDKNVIEIAKLNHYSKDLFEKENIKLINADLIEEIKKFKDDSFDNVVLDTGIFRECGEVFSLSNYKEIYRILKKQGKLYHYVPSPEIKKGRSLISEVINRLKQLSFKNIQKIKDYAIIAQKERV